MNSHELRQLQMLRRVRDFGLTRVTDFPGGSLSGSLFTSLSRTITRLESEADTQTTSHGDGMKETAVRTSARKALEQTLMALYRTARAMSFDNPGLDNKFRLPRKSDDASLLEFARVAAATATPLTSAFIEHEMPADFLATLTTQTTAFTEAINAGTTARTTRTVATDSISRVIAEGMQTIIRLDAIVRNKYAGDPASLQTWKTIRRIGRAAGSGAGATEPQETAVIETSGKQE
ncbi:MAG: hypothetical protein ACKV2V_14245 [Blastocatellia bacterium]